MVKWAASDILQSEYMGTFEERKVPAENSWPESRESASEDHTSNAGRKKKSSCTKVVITALLIIEEKNDSKEKKKKTSEAI